MDKLAVSVWLRSLLPGSSSVRCSLCQNTGTPGHMCAYMFLQRPQLSKPRYSVGRLSRRRFWAIFLHQCGAPAIKSHKATGSLQVLPTQQHPLTLKRPCHQSPPTTPLHQDLFPLFSTHTSWEWSIRQAPQGQSLGLPVVLIKWSGGGAFGG